MANKYVNEMWAVTGRDSVDNYFETTWTKKAAMELARDWKAPRLEVNMCSTASFIGEGLGLRDVRVFKISVTEKSS